MFVRNHYIIFKLYLFENFRLGERANDIGPLAVFRERVEAADEDSLAAGNFTGCDTIEAVKNTGADYRKKMKFDENVYTECRIRAFAYRKGEVISKKVQGKVIIYEKIIL